MKLGLLLIIITIFLSTNCRLDTSSIENGNNETSICDTTRYYLTPPDTMQNPYTLTQGQYPDWSPTGDKIAFIRDNKLWIHDLTNHMERIITTNAIEPSFAPDGQQIAFERDRQIWIVDIENCKETYLCDGVTPSWSENGKWIAFGHKTASHTLPDGSLAQNERSPDSSLYYYDLEKEQIERVIVTNYDSIWTGVSISMYSPVWAQNDSILIFDTEVPICKVSRKGGRAERVITIGPAKLAYISIPRQPDFNDNKQRLAYTEFIGRDDIGDILTHVVLGFISRDSLRVHYLGGSYYADPSWQLDGNRLALYSEGNILIYNWR